MRVTLMDSESRNMDGTKKGKNGGTIGMCKNLNENRCEGMPVVRVYVYIWCWEKCAKEETRKTNDFCGCECERKGTGGYVKNDHFFRLNIRFSAFHRLGFLGETILSSDQHVVKLFLSGLGADTVGRA